MTIAPRFASRPGGYTRLLRLGFRKGDSAAVAQLAREVEVRRYIAGHIECLARQVLDDAPRPPGLGRDRG